MPSRFPNIIFMGIKFFNRSELTLAIQRLHLKKMFPDADCQIHGNTLTWKGRICPTCLSDSYLVELIYRQKGSPKVFVREPQLQRRNGQRAPHLYDEGNLCLHYPDEWTPNMILSDSILPWTSEWLLHYEVWLATGEWCGGGTHPVRSQSNLETEVSNN